MFAKIEYCAGYGISSHYGNSAGLNWLSFNLLSDIYHSCLFFYSNSNSNLYAMERRAASPSAFWTTPTSRRDATNSPRSLVQCPWARALLRWVPTWKTAVTTPPPLRWWASGTFKWCAFRNISTWPWAAPWYLKPVTVTQNKGQNNNLMIESSTNKDSLSSEAFSCAAFYV